LFSVVIIYIPVVLIVRVWNWLGWLIINEEFRLYNNFTKSLLLG